MNKISYKEFLANCKKAPPPSKIYYTYIYHELTYPLSFLLFKLGISPNAINLLGLFTGILGGIFIFFLHPITGTALLLLSYLFDCCDGNVARIQYRYLGRQVGESHKQGMLFENLYPNITYFLFFVGLGYYFFTTTENFLYLMFGMFAYAMKIITRYTVLHMSMLNRQVGPEGLPQKEKNIFQTSWINEFKYFVVRVVDCARMYYVAFLVIFIFFPDLAPLFFVLYMALIFILNFIKLVITVVLKRP